VRRDRGHAEAEPGLGAVQPASAPRCRASGSKGLAALPRGVMQLFGPWTATQGPWKAVQIKGPNPYQRQRLADQQWVLRAHQNHIHVAR